MRFHINHALAIVVALCSTQQESPDFKLPATDENVPAVRCDVMVGFRILEKVILGPNKFNRTKVL